MPTPLYLLAAQCPKDGWRPGVRITARQIELMQGEPPDVVVGEAQCPNSRCGHKYPLTARAYQEAKAA